MDDILTVFASRDKLTKLQRDNVEQDISAEKAVVFMVLTVAFFHNRPKTKEVFFLLIISVFS